LATGLSGSLPLMLTMVQNGFYFVPALPYFGLAFAILNVSPIYSFIVNIKATVLPYLQKVSVGIAFAVLAFIYSRIGHTVRDQSMLQDVHLLGKSLPAFTSLGAQTDVYKNSPLACYLVRYYNISLNRSDTNRYYLGVKNGTMDLEVPLQKVDIPLHEFDLYERRN
jgi:hypothetical protein